MAQPPPIPKSALGDQSSNSFAHHAAKASWILPLAGFVISLFGQAVLLTQPQEYRVWGGMILGGVAFLSIIVGLVLGVTALCGMAKHGTKGILGHALTGTILCGLLVVAGVALAAIPAFQRAKARAEASRKSIAEIKESQKEAIEATRNAIQGGTNYNNALQKSVQLQKSLLNASQNLKGDDALVLQAGSSYLQKLNELNTNYHGALAGLKAAKVLKASSVKEKTELADRRETVQAFLKVNDTLKTFIAHGEENFRAECDALHVSPDVADKAVAAYRTKANAINPLMIKIRETDDQIGQGMLGIIALEEVNWGHWSVSSADGKIHFENSGQARDYNSYLQQIREASDEQNKLLQRLLNTEQQEQQQTQ